MQTVARPTKAPFDYRPGSWKLRIPRQAADNVLVWAPPTVFFKLYGIAGQFTAGIIPGGEDDFELSGEAGVTYAG